MKLTISPKHYQLPLKHPFTISRYTVYAQDTVIVSISNGDCVGYGEATVNPYYGITIDKIQNSIQRVRSIVENSPIIKPEEFWRHLQKHLIDDYFTLCAIDCAYWDFYARLNHRTTRSFWNNNIKTLPLTNYTIGIDTVENMQAKILEKPWPIYKIKLGTPNDLYLVESLRKVANSVFRIDANASWTVKETLHKAAELKPLGVEFIEQPLKADDWEGMKQLKDKSELPIIADESCLIIEDVDKCAEAFHGINIKLMKCGGITPALQMIKKAREHQLLVMAGCMTESSVGISNLAQLASLLDYIDADGALLLEKDIAQGVQFRDGEILFSEGFGSGSKLV